MKINNLLKISYLKSKNLYTKNFKNNLIMQQKVTLDYLACI